MFNSSINICLLIVFTILLFFQFINIQCNHEYTTITPCVERNISECDNFKNKCCEGLNCKHTVNGTYKCFYGNCSITTCNPKNNQTDGCCYGLFCSGNTKTCKSILGIPEIF
ncbi:hypothetical protein ACQ4LE_010569 [Meloidogyne hapla]